MTDDDLEYVYRDDPFGLPAPDYKPLPYTQAAMARAATPTAVVEQLPPPVQAPPSSSPSPASKPISTLPPILDLRALVAPGGIKYTCTFCEKEYVSSKVKKWWRKPGNERRLPPIPICPDCGNAGAVTGWGIDFSHRRGVGEQCRKQREEYLRIMQTMRTSMQVQKAGNDNGLVERFRRRSESGADNSNEQGSSQGDNGDLFRD